MNVNFRKSYLMLLFLVSMLMLSVNSYAYKTEGDCEAHEGSGGCCKASDGTYHKDGGCECIMLALDNGDMKAYDQWITMVEKEYGFYARTEALCKEVAKKDREIANQYLKELNNGSDSAKSKLAEVTKKAEESEAKLKKAINDTIWAKEEINKVKKYKAKAKAKDSKEKGK